MTLGEWLNQMIIDGGEPEALEPEPVAYADPRRRILDEMYAEARAVRQPGPPPRVGEAAEIARVARALNELALRMEAAEHRSSLAISGVDQSVLEVLTRLDAIERDQGAVSARTEGASVEVRATQARIADQLRRMEQDGGARVESFKALEQALGRVAEQMQAGETRTEAAAQASREAEARLSERVEAVEVAAAAAPHAYADADKVEVVLSRMADRLDQAETRTAAAVQSLESSFAGLDARLRSSDARGAGASVSDVEGRFQTLAQELSRRVEGSRAELADKLRAAADGRLDRMDAVLSELRGHVDQAEQRSAQAIDRIGREVLRVAHGMGERMTATEEAAAARAAQVDARVSAVETRSAATMETIGGEVARIADVMEDRMRQADGAQAEAMEKLGSEIARIAERLAERISSSDRRSAEAIDEVTDRVAKLGERMDARHDRSANDLAERIRLSEERTAKLLDNARERLEHTLGPRPSPASTPSRAFAPDPAPEPTPASAPLRASNADPFGFADEPESGPYAAVLMEPAPPPMALEPTPHAAAPVSPPPADFAVDDEVDPFAHRGEFAEPSPFDPQEDFAHPEPQPQAAAFGGSSFMDPPPAVEAAAEPLFGGFSVGDFAPPPESMPSAAQMSTREMLEAARHAARSANAQPEASRLGPLGGVRAPRPFGLTLPGRRKRETAPTLRTIALASVTAGAITTAAVGAYMLGGASSHDGSPHAAPMPDLAAAAPSAAPAISAPSSSSTTTPSLAVALTPTALPDHVLDIPVQKAAAVSARKAPATAAPIALAEPAPAAASPAARSPHLLYTSAVGRIETGDLTAVGDLKTAADGGDADAQFYLARLYEAGGAGLGKDLTQARRWTLKAAQGGDPMAMYNLASYAYAGDGGAKDLAQAWTWFRRAAEHGVVNAQYNLAQLYEKGYGGPQDLGQAYKWYTAAADAGDAGARTAAEALKPRLAPTAIAEAERSAASLHAQAGGAPVRTAAARAPAQP